MEARIIEVFKIRGTYLLTLDSQYTIQSNGIAFDSEGKEYEYSLVHYKTSNMNLNTEISVKTQFVGDIVKFSS